MDIEKRLAEIERFVKEHGEQVVAEYDDGSYVVRNYEFTEPMAWLCATLRKAMAVCEAAKTYRILERRVEERGYVAGTIGDRLTRGDSREILDAALAALEEADDSDAVGHLSEVVQRYTAGLLDAGLSCRWNVRAKVVPAETQVIVEVDELPIEERARLFRVHSDIVKGRLDWDIDFRVSYGADDAE